MLPAVGSFFLYKSLLIIKEVLKERYFGSVLKGAMCL